MPRDIDAALSRYIDEVQRYPQLTREEELELTRAFLQHASPAVADRLVRAHLRFVVAIALKYRRYGLPLADLIAEGNFGVVHALRKFEPERGHRFVTYAAYWIRACILNYIIRSWSMVGVGSGALRSKIFFRLRRERVRVLNLVGEGEEANRLLAEKLDLPVDRVVEMVRRLEGRDVSLDAKVFEDAPGTMVDTLVSPESDQETRAARSEQQALAARLVGQALDGLDPRERLIVEQRLMADSEDEVSLAELGRRLGVSRERARQLEARARKKLRARVESLARTSGQLEVLSAA